MIVVVAAEVDGDKVKVSTATVDDNKNAKEEEEEDIRSVFVAVAILPELRLCKSITPFPPQISILFKSQGKSHPVVGRPFKFKVLPQ